MQKKPPIILGIINITPDSFSDGGQFLKPELAGKHAKALMQGGADILDLGAASSHPDAKQVNAEEELSRLRPVLEELQAKNWPLSVDTHQVRVQRYALRKGVKFLNDIHGFQEAHFYPELAESDCRLIVMHSIHGQHQAKAVRQVTDPQAVYSKMLQFFECRLRAFRQQGIALERVILDPGMGFFLGSNPESSIHVLQRLQELKAYFHLPLLVSVSRKSFLGEMTQSPVHKRGAASLSAELFAWVAGVDYIRTHNVRALCDAVKVWSSLATNRF